MKDHLGLYYYPFPQNKKIRMYVRRGDDEPEFRMWNQADPQMWAMHDWVPYSAIVQAKTMFKGGAFDPDRAYDADAAKALLHDDN